MDPIKIFPGAVALIKIIEDAQEGIAIGDLNGNLTYVNKSFCRIWELDSCAEALGQDARTFWNDPKEAQKVIDNIMRDGFWIGLLEAQTLKNKTKRLGVAARVLFDGDEPIALSSSFFDYSLEYQYKNSLEEGREGYQFLYNAVPAFLVVLDEYFKVVLVSDYGLNRTNLKRKEVVGKSVFDFIAQDSMAEVKNALTSTTSYNDLIGKKLHVLKADGRTINVELLGATEQYFEPGKLSYVVVAKDLSETEELINTIDILEQGIHQTYGTFILTDKNKNIIFSNKATKAITQFDNEELIGKNVKEVFASDNTHPSVYKELNKALAAGKTWQGEFVNRKKDGTLYWEEALVSPIVDKLTGETTHYFKIGKDVSEKKEFERNRRMAESLMQHDLRNPLNSLITFPKIILEDGDNLTDEQKMILTEMHKAGRNMLDLLDSQLAMSKLEDDDYVLPIEPIEILAILEEVLSDHNNKIGNKRLLLKKQLLDAESLSGYGNRALLYSAFSNILVNAVEASPSDKELVIITKIEKSEIVISFTNTGAVPVHIRNSFFKKYATYGKQNGTGIGTYSYKRIITKMGGDVTMETSDENNTTTITVKLPKDLDAFPGFPQR